VLGLFTIIYLEAIQPSLVNSRVSNHNIIIKNTVDHLERLKININKEEINKFLLSTGFLFQGLDRVQFFSLEGKLVGDTNTLDLDPKVFLKNEPVLFDLKDGSQNILTDQNFIQIENDEQLSKNLIQNIQNESYVTQTLEKKNFFVSTYNKILIGDELIGYIKVSEQANDILIAVDERKNFIIRTVLAIALMILIFSLFLNKYILKPLKFLSNFTESVRDKSSKNVNIEKLFIREDEIGKLTKSIDEMTKELQKRANRAETFSSDLAHEIRNPLASLKGASELLDKSSKTEDRGKLLKIIDHDVERIERLITDYSQMLKDEASLSREKMTRIDLLKIIQNVVEDFKQDLENRNKNIDIEIGLKNNNGKDYFLIGIESRIEQVIANLLDNAISFSSDKQIINIDLSETTTSFVLIIKDQGPGFAETSTNKIFKRFYSNRPKNFGEHSGLGLNIVKNIVELHQGKIAASNRIDSGGAQIEILLPKLQ
tara:strand:- start:1529 stop:2983 length:1455 start_codon:yes stop_codon:yes gene_type:complete